MAFQPVTFYLDEEDLAALSERAAAFKVTTASYMETLARQEADRIRRIPPILDSVPNPHAYEVVFRPRA